MTEPQDPPPLSLADTAAEPPEESVRRERELLGDQPDTGGLVDEDSAQ